MDRSGVEGHISPIHDTPSVATLTHKHTGTCTQIRMSGSLSQRLWLQQIWESSTSGALTFPCEVKRGNGVCVRGCVNAGQKENEGERKDRGRKRDKNIFFIVLTRLQKRG